MVRIESQATSEKEWDLSFLMKMLTEAQELNDDVQAKKITKRALEQAKIQGNKEWEAKFQAILDRYSNKIEFKEASQEESTLSENEMVTDLSEVQRRVPEIEVRREDLKKNYPEEEVSPTIREEMEEVLSIEDSDQEEFKDDVILPSHKNPFMEGTDFPPFKTHILPSKRIIVGVEDEPEIFQTQSVYPTKTTELKSKVPYREQRIKNLPNAEQLLQRQQSAQEILQVIRAIEMIEIPMNKPELREIFRAVDLLACKPMRGDNGRCIILLIPIKHVSTTDPVYVWDSHVMTGQINSDPTTTQNMAINTHTKKLLQASEYLFSDMLNGHVLISLVARHIGISMKANLVFKNQRLYLGSGEIEYQIIIDPILLCDTQIYCLEKSLPYAYQRSSNLHVVSHNQLNDLLEYLQLKYRLLNRHDISQNAIMKVKDTKLSTFKQLQLFSLPFLAYGVLFSFFLILGIQEIVRFCISLGFGLMFVYGGSIGYLLYRHFQSLKHVGSEFSVPYHQKPTKLAEEDFILINEHLSPEMTAQFSYEVENHEKSSYQKSVKHKKSRATTSNIPSPLVKEEEILQNIPKNRQPSGDNQVISKYQAFLDD